MSKQFWVFLLAGLAIVGIVVYGSLFANKSSHLELDGDILKVRVMALGPAASLVVADFRVKNPSGLPFVVKSVRVRLEPASGDALEAEPISKVNLENVFHYEKLIGPQYNAALTMHDTIPAHGTVDRMVGVRFEVPESAISSRKALRMRIEEVDGAAAEIGEKKP
jgi:hypothetical protein